MSMFNVSCSSWDTAQTKWSSSLWEGHLCVYRKTTATISSAISTMHCLGTQVVVSERLSGNFDVYIRFLLLLIFMSDLNLILQILDNFIHHFKLQKKEKEITYLPKPQLSVSMDSIFTSILKICHTPDIEFQISYYSWLQYHQ